MSTRSELKENLLAARLEGVVRYIVENRQKVLSAAAVVLGTLLVGSVFVMRRKELAEMNWTRLSQGQSFF